MTSNEELTAKYNEYYSGDEGLRCYIIENVNHKPHPYVVGPRHVAFASERGGILSEHTIREAEKSGVKCACRGCNVPFEGHTSNKVCFLQATREIKNSEVRDLLLRHKDEAEKDGIDGFAFVESDYKIVPDEEEKEVIEELTEEEKAGVKAIIYLQQMGGITETREEAIAGWRAMSNIEKQTTMRVYNQFNPKGE